ncbi:hypothetical protein BCV69DRAFT_295756 [Microstroma glucosiphilum]|uniref:Uncharacterized protein n=1 Tax=Pseudomicrostroma glucosiphilum TaxID=1684307 RepID=A0A316TWL0_9BASI|nr:hypothetical protein BCV69DRAFT_295756 [Pseudomicrostroma glucosiphilum]PWN17727.1 hypothetical protein BCV69DRAFT_295756 [Pseudomicrostroma glucosiphilum]
MPPHRSSTVPVTSHTSPVDVKPKIEHDAKHTPNVCLASDIDKKPSPSEMQYDATHRELKVLRKEREKWRKQKQDLKAQLETHEMLLDLYSDQNATYRSLLAEARDRLQKLTIYKARAANNRKMLVEMKKHFDSLTIPEEDEGERTEDHDDGLSDADDTGEHQSIPAKSFE